MRVWTRTRSLTNARKSNLHHACVLDTCRHPNEPLIPPADVAWLWHCHRLAPRLYKEYTQSEFKLEYLDAGAPFSLQLAPSTTGATRVIVNGSAVNGEQLARQRCESAYS